MVLMMRIKTVAIMIVLLFLSASFLVEKPDRFLENGFPQVATLNNANTNICL